MPPAADIAGEVFGDLEALRPVERNAHGQIVWVCRCLCGGFALRTAGALRGSVKRKSRPCCRVCLEELRRGSGAYRGAGRHAWLLEYFETYGLLYSAFNLGMPEAPEEPVRAGSAVGWRDEPIAIDRSDSVEPRTLQEIGDELGLSRERVRQILDTALAKLRLALDPEIVFLIEREERERRAIEEASRHASAVEERKRWRQEWATRAELELQRVDPPCRVCGEPRSAHMPGPAGPLTHPREARGEGYYVLYRGTYLLITE